MRENTETETLPHTKPMIFDLSNLKQYLQDIFGGRREERRREPRYTVRLTAGIARADVKTASPLFKGHTCNISESGLAFIIPSVSADDAAELGGNSKLRVLISLPAKMIVVEVTGVYFKSFNEQLPGQGCFFGARITKMSDEDRSLYTAYLHELAGK